MAVWVVDWDAADATANIQAGLDSGSDEVLLPYRGADWITRPLFLRSKKTLILEPGVRVAAKAGEFLGVNDRLVQGDNLDQVRIIGYGAELVMRREDYLKSPYTPSEFRHVLMLNGCRDVTVEGLLCQDAGGDGLYVGPYVSGSRLPCQRVRLIDLDCHRNHRQGCSVTSAVNLHASGCTFRSTRGTSPQSGVDVEPPHYQDRAELLRFEGCRFLDNANHAFVSNTNAFTAASAPVSIELSKCVFRGSGGTGHGIYLRTPLVGADVPAGTISVLNSLVQDTFEAGVRVEMIAENPLGVIFDRLTLERTARAQTEKPFELEVYLGGDASKRGVQFSNCRVFDDVARLAIQMPVSGPAWAYGARGTLAVQNAAHPANLTPITDLWPFMSLSV